MGCNWYKPFLHQQLKLSLIFSHDNHIRSDINHRGTVVMIPQPCKTFLMTGTLHPYLMDSTTLVALRKTHESPVHDRNYILFIWIPTHPWGVWRPSLCHLIPTRTRGIHCNNMIKDSVASKCCEEDMWGMINGSVSLNACVICLCTECMFYHK